jgi:two-component system, LuxR family, sensor kinase FixL
VNLDALEFMPDAVLVTGDDGSIRYVNRAAEELFGYARTELFGRPVEILIPARFRTQHRLHRHAYAAAPRVRPMGMGLDLRALRKDGQECPVEISLAPLSVGAETFTVTAVRDVTERKQFEERARQLDRIREEIRQRDEVLAIASHELRAPVGIVQLQVGILRRAATDTVNELTAMRERMGTTAADLTAMRERMGTTAEDLSSMRDRMGRIERHTRQLSRLIEQLLDVTHMQQGALTLKLEDTDLADLTREVVGSLAEEIERAGSNVKVEASGPVSGRWDPLRIEQVIGNLLLNACKFGQGKPITVHVEGAPEQAQVLVTDRGVGISPSDHVRIFERFERAVTAGGVLGLGLGLYIARQIVEAHGGRIQVRSAIGEGSTFTVQLPRMPARP